jgi:hypothetical protein
MSAWIPGTIRRRLASASTLAICALLAAFLFLKLSPVATPVKWDECLYVYDAQRVLDGQVPYRDFFNFTPPGVFWLQACWYALWGGKASLTLGRLLAALAALGSALLIHRALRRAGWRSTRAWGWAALYPIGLYAFWAVPSHHWFANLLFFSAFEAYDFEKAKVRGLRGWVWIGLMGGGALLFLQSTVLEIALFWGTLWALQGVRKARALASACAGFSLMALPVLGWLWTSGALGASARDVILWPLRNYAQPGGPNAVGLLADWPSRVGSLWILPEGAPLGRWALQAFTGTATYGGLLLFTFVVLLALGKGLVGILRRRSLPGGLLAPTLALTALDVALFLQGKTDWLHLLYFLGPVGLAWLLVPADGTRSWPAPWRRSLAALAGFTLLAALLFHSGRAFAGHLSWWEFSDVDRPVREAPVNRWLRVQPWLLPGDRLAAFPEGGQVYLYTRPAAVGYTLFLPLGDHYNTLEDHRVVAGQIETAKPRCILLTADREADFLDPASPVGRAIRSGYHRLERVEDAVVYLRDTP